MGSDMNAVIRFLKNYANNNNNNDEIKNTDINNNADNIT